MRAGPRRALVVDGALGLGLAWLGWLGAHVAWTGPPVERHPPWSRGESEFHGWLPETPAVVPFLLLLAAGVAVRRRWPRLGFVAVVVGLGGFLALGASVGPLLLAPALVVYVLALRLPVRQWAPLTVLLVPMILAGHWREPYLGLLDPALYAGALMAISVVVLPATFALLRRVRRDTERREREQDRQRYASEERLRIAREVHDVVGHSLSVITLQAGVALHVLEKQPEQVGESLEAIRRTSREALAELATTLQVFREPDGGAPRSPGPGLARLDDLVAALVGAGREVRVIQDAYAGPPLPSAVDQAAFRIIQEALTNVVRHAGPAAATVRVAHQGAGLAVEVVDDGPATEPPAEGNGIRGMRERAQAVGGTLRVGPVEPHGLVVSARLPVTAGAGA